MKSFEDVISRYEVKRRSGNHAQCICPVHDDHRASLSITGFDSGKIGIKCFTGCDKGDVLAAGGLTWEDIGGNSEGGGKESWQVKLERDTGKQVKARYDYLQTGDGLGKYVWTKVRLVDEDGGKDFKAGRIIDGKWFYGKPKGAPPSGYAPGGMNNFSRSVKAGEDVFIVEGEKDAETLCAMGMPSFTAGSASDWKPDHATLFEGAHVFILRDNDAAGERVAGKIYSSLKGKAAECHVINPAEGLPKGDVTDYFDEMGHSEEDFARLLEDARHGADEDRAAELSEYHVYNDKGEPTRPDDNKIREDIIKKYPLFVCEHCYIYDNGVYRMDADGKKLWAIVEGYLFDSVKRARLIAPVCELVTMTEKLSKGYEDFNRHPKSYINFEDTMLDARTMQEVPHDPGFLSVNQVPFRWASVKAARDGPEIEKFFKFIFKEPDDRQMFLEYAGLCLTTDTSQQVFMTIVGQGGTGKSTLIQLVENAAGRKNVSNVALQDFSQRFAASALVGKTLNTSGDLSAEPLEDSSMTKKLTGEDYINTEFKGKAMFSFRSYAKHLFSANSIPIVRGERSNGFYRRLLVLNIDRQPEKPDAGLADRLLKETPYFIRLAVEALHEMYARGRIAASKTSMESVEALRKDSDVVEAWLGDRCARGAGLKIGRGDAYDSFDAYCEDEGRRSMSKNGFYRALREKGFGEAKNRDGRFFLGLSIRNGDMPDDVKPDADGFIHIPDGVDVDLPFS